MGVVCVILVCDEGGEGGYYDFCAHLIVVRDSFVDVGVAEEVDFVIPDLQGAGACLVGCTGLVVNALTKVIRFYSG